MSLSVPEQTDLPSVWIQRTPPDPKDFGTKASHLTFPEKALIFWVPKQWDWMLCLHKAYCRGYAILKHLPRKLEENFFGFETIYFIQFS